MRHCVYHILVTVYANNLIGRLDMAANGPAPAVLMRFI